MRSIYVKHPFGSLYARILLSIAAVFLVTFAFVRVAGAESTKPSEPAPGQRVVTIYDQGKKRVVLTNATSVKDTLAQADISLSQNDIVEPAATTQFVANDYTINIYRAKPVMIVDGMRREQILSPYTSAKDIANYAREDVHPEDILKLEQSEDVLTDGVGMRLTITRATPLTLVLYGQRTTIYTQSKTVGELLSDKSITLAADDTISAVRTASITPGMTIEIWRNGVQTVTEQQAVDYTSQQIQDADQPASYRQVKTPGVKGEKNVTYEVTMKNGQEVARKEIQSVVTKQPAAEVVIVGAKPSFDGDFAAALAKLRSCEGSYTSVNPSGYYGAYQFTQSAWNSNAPSGYSGVNPTQAPPAVQDQAARNYYVKSGWRPWPSCGASLPDIYR